MYIEYWDCHEYVREHARCTTAGLSHGHPALVRLVEVLGTQWGEDYFKPKPFAVRLNSEDFDTFSTLAEARECFDSITQLYNGSDLSHVVAGALSQNRVCEPQSERKRGDEMKTQTVNGSAESAESEINSSDGVVPAWTCVTSGKQVRLQAAPERDAGMEKG